MGHDNQSAAWLQTRGPLGTLCYDAKSTFSHESAATAPHATSVQTVDARLQVLQQIFEARKYSNRDMQIWCSGQINVFDCPGLPQTLGALSTVVRPPEIDGAGA